MLGGSLAGLSPKFVYKKNSQPPMSEFTFIDVHIIYIYTHTHVEYTACANV